MSLVLFYHFTESEIIRAVRFGIIVCNGGIVSVKDISHMSGIRDYDITFPQNNIGSMAFIVFVGETWFSGFVKILTSEVCITFSIEIRLNRGFLQFNDFVSQSNIILPRILSRLFLKHPFLHILRCRIVFRNSEFIYGTCSFLIHLVFCGACSFSTDRNI